jgi:catalase
MARKSIKSDAVKLKGETAKKAPPLPAGADQPTNYADSRAMAAKPARRPRTRHLP